MWWWNLQKMVRSELGISWFLDFGLFWPPGVLVDLSDLFAFCWESVWHRIGGRWQRPGF